MIRTPSLLALARVLAWGAGYGAVIVVAYAYAVLPDELPLTRWSVAPKSMFFALRVPLIHFALVGLSDIAARCLSRLPTEHRPAADRAGATLLCTAGIEAWLAAVQILRLPDPNRASNAVAFAVAVAGVGLVAWNVRSLLGADGLRSLRATRVEQLLGGALVLSLLLLNLPLLAPRLFR